MRTYPNQDRQVRSIGSCIYIDIETVLIPWARVKPVGFRKTKCT